MIKAVLFDWNGVIIDDLDAIARADCDVIFELGGQKIDHEIWFKEITQDWHAFFINKGVKKEDLHKVLPLIKNFYPKYIDYIKLTAGSKEVLDFLYQKGIRMGVLSGSDKFSINSNIDKFGLKKYFEFIISGEDVKNPKPHPEGLAKAIKNFQVDPHFVLYVEDMPTIFSGAKKLGMTTVELKSRISGDLSVADIKITDMKQIIDIINKLIIK